MILIRILASLALAFVPTVAMAQQPEIHFGEPGEGMPPAPRPENYLAKCIANPDDRISCHLARNAETDGGLENYVRGDVAQSAYVTCTKAGGVTSVCLELATLDLDEADAPQKPRLASIDIAILFDYDKASLRASEDGKLRQLATALQADANANAQFAVIGHTDSRGSDAYNCGLSGRRAQAVVHSLGALGVPMARLRAVSAGEKLLRDPANSEAAINRRVGFARLTDDSKAVTSRLFTLCLP